MSLTTILRQAMERLQTRFDPATYRTKPEAEPTWNKPKRKSKNKSKRKR
jgi:hypothetical protein